MNADACLNFGEGNESNAAAGVATELQGDELLVTVNLSHLFPGESFKLLLRLVNNDRDRQTTARISTVQFVTLAGLPPIALLPSTPPGNGGPGDPIASPGSNITELPFDSSPVPTENAPSLSAQPPQDPSGPLLSISAPIDGSSAPAGTPVLLSGSAVALAFADPNKDPNVFLSFEDFSQPEQLTLNGTAQPVLTADGQVLRLTPATASASGSAFSSTRVNAGSFSTYFTFRLTESGGISQSSIRREVYAGIPGNTIGDLVNSPAFPDHPSSVELLSTAFEAPRDVGQDYGQRLSGFLIAPSTGDYTFWIASDDQGELYLGLDGIPDHKARIAQVSTWTLFREWTKEPGQQSAPIRLEAGKRYYLEALMKEGGGGDSLSVRWRLPNGAIEEPIPASRFTEPGADGLVFVVQSVSSSIGGSGGGIGYAGIPNSVGVEFDTWWNGEQNDPDSNHVGIDANGSVDHGAPAAFTAGIRPNFDNGLPWHAWVDYDGTTLEVRVSQSIDRPMLPTLSRVMDIPVTIGSNDAYVGFTSGTGGAWG